MHLVTVSTRIPLLVMDVIDRFLYEHNVIAAWNVKILIYVKLVSHVSDFRLVTLL
jgi:hypothetical protein